MKFQYVSRMLQERAFCKFEFFFLRSFVLQWKINKEFVNIGKVYHYLKNSLFCVEFSEFQFQQLQLNRFWSKFPIWCNEILHIQLRYLFTKRDKALLSKYENSLTIRFSEWQNKIINTMHVCERKRLWYGYRLQTWLDLLFFPGESNSISVDTIQSNYIANESKTLKLNVHFVFVTSSVWMGSREGLKNFSMFIQVKQLQIYAKCMLIAQTARS